MNDEASNAAPILWTIARHTQSRGRYCIGKRQPDHDLDDIHAQSSSASGLTAGLGSRYFVRCFREDFREGP